MLLQNGSTVEAHVKGNFRIKGIRSTNPVAVGDRVTVESLPDGTNWITDICDRRNYIIRRATNLSKQSHILAANVDQVALLVTVNHPKTSTTFIDRFLATCEAYRVPAALVFNKIDLYDATDMAELEYMRLLYTEIGYPVYCISATRLDHELDGLLSGKTTLLSGNSGVGKSTLLNSLFGEEKTRTGIISDAHDRGMHTTTFSEMYFLSPDTAIIDTPGIKGFGTFDMQREGHTVTFVTCERSVVLQQGQLFRLCRHAEHMSGHLIVFGRSHPGKSLSDNVLYLMRVGNVLRINSQ